MSEAAKKYLVAEYVPQLLKTRSILQDSDKSDYVIDLCRVLPVATDGTFMLSLCNRVKVDLKEVGNNENILHLDLVIKLSPRDLPPELFELMAKKLFQNEILVYTKVLPQLTHIGYYPKFYSGKVGDKECSLVLGDFGVDGWRMAPTLVNLSLEHILLAVKYLGKFHGNCYAMKEWNNDAFQDIVSQLSKTRFEQVTTGQPSYDEYTRLTPKRGISAVRNSPEYEIEEEYLNHLQDKLVDPATLCRDLVQPLEPLAVICHGDYLRNNIAFKYADNEELQCPIGVTMFDFQTMCYTSPMMDLVTFMANSTGVDVRGRHFEEIFRAYHTVLINVLADKQQQQTTRDDLQARYSYNNFLQEYLRLLPFGYSVASTFIPMLHVPLEADFSTDIIETEEAFREMLSRGGETVDRELAALVNDIYQLEKRINADINGSS